MVVQRWPAVPDRGEHDAAHGQVEVGGRGDDGGVVAAELQQRAPEPGGDDRPDLRRPSGSEPVAETSATCGCATRASPTSRPPRTRRRDVGRGAGLGQRPVEQRRAGQRGQRA